MKRSQEIEATVGLVHSKLTLLISDECVEINSGLADDLRDDPDTMISIEPKVENSYDGEKTVYVSAVRSDGRMVRLTDGEATWDETINGLDILVRFEVLKVLENMKERNSVEAYSDR